MDGGREWPRFNSRLVFPCQSVCTFSIPLARPLHPRGCPSLHCSSLRLTTPPNPHHAYVRNMSQQQQGRPSRSQDGFAAPAAGANQGARATRARLGFLPRRHPPLQCRHPPAQAPRHGRWKRLARLSSAVCGHGLPRREPGPWIGLSRRLPRGACGRARGRRRWDDTEWRRCCRRGGRRGKGVRRADRASRRVPSGQYR